MHSSRLLMALALLLARLAGAAEPTTAAPPPKSQEEALQRAGVKLVSGPATVPLGQVAELRLPEGHHVVAKESLDRFYELTQNVRSGHELGVVLAPGYMLFFDYDESGYVKDDDQDKLDADKLMQAMTANQEASNDDRKQRGWAEMRLKGWATPPHYDAKTHHLKWAINLTSAQDGFKQVWINESIRLLGRGGVMNVTLASSTENFKGAEAAADKILSEQFEYVTGQKYAEFKTGDKVAAYGLSALVLGGGAVLAAKMGLFAKLGVFLGKAWKVIVFVLIAAGAGLKKVWNKVTGARPDRSPPRS